MTIFLEWVNSEHTIIYSSFVGRWEWSEYKTAFHKLTTMIASSPHIVHVINDINQSHLPTGPAILQRFMVMWDTMPHNVGLIINVAGKNLPARLILEMSQRISQRAAKVIRVVNCTEDAYALLAYEYGVDTSSLSVGV